MPIIFDTIKSDFVLSTFLERVTFTNPITLLEFIISGRKIIVFCETEQSQKSWKSEFC